MNAADNKIANCAPHGISLQEKVTFLKQKKNYPDHPTHVKTVRTHMSWVFLTDQYVYKLKISFRFDHMQLLTLEARHRNCQEEVRLNKRLAEDVYIGVIPLLLNKEGHLSLREGQQTVDWLVKMKRLPEKNILEERIKTGRKISENHLQPVAEVLAKFYTHADTVNITPKDQYKRLKIELNKYGDELKSPEYGLDRKKLDWLLSEQLKFVDEHASLLKTRIDDGRIIEGHGDLKPDHICLSPPGVIDCLEFSKQLRTLDVLEDMGFLSLECDRLGVPWIGEFFISYYARQADDCFPQALLNFYKSCRATIRALLSIRHFREKRYQKDPKWRKRTGTYLKLAEKYILEAEH